VGTILIVDGDDARRGELARALAGDEDTTLAVETLEAAREALVAFMPDLVVAAVELPDGTGYQLCRRVRALHGNHVSVVLLAPAGTEPTSALLAGADDVIVGPGLEPLRARCDRARRQARWLLRA
jgi:two-component system, OmpR family, response regulator VicR